MVSEPVITAQDIADQKNRKKRTVEYSIKKLRDVGILAREGADKSGQWIVSQPE